MSQKVNPTYISLFSGAGIGCYGFKLAGFDCIATNEFYPKRLKFQKFNKKCKYESGYIPGDISKIEVKNKLIEEVDFWKVKHKINDIDVIIATPPCQGMSVANHKKKNEIGRNSLVVESIKITKEILPKYFIFENVRAFLNTICTDIDGLDKSIEDSINNNLAGYYNILSDVINFKDYGSNSSRTRTLVIGVRKDLKDITPYDIFPQKNSPQTLRKLIGKLPKLQTMGEISDDIYHSYRSYDDKMLPWIKDLKEGQSAFDNNDPKKIPHRVIDGKVVFNKNKNGNKYCRWFWDKEGPCIHTRNDILASQNTIHPSDNRVFSIREIMKMLSIPNSFKWSDLPDTQLNNLELDEKRKYLLKEEMNIRQCLGEAVPTAVFESIANNIINVASSNLCSVTTIKKIISQNDLFNIDNLIGFIENDNTYPVNTLFEIAEFANSKRQDTAAYFTRQDIAYTVIRDLPILKNKKILRILEPSVGVGNFLPLLFAKYSMKEKVIIDVCDIDSNSLTILKAILYKTGIPKNFIINFINEDFLLWNTTEKYDVIIGNPPYKKIKSNNDKLSLYRKEIYNKDTNNLFAFFIEKAIILGRYVTLIVPKSILNSPEFNKTRDLLLSKDLIKVSDFGEKGFYNVKIETICFLIDTVKQKTNDNIAIESYIKNQFSIEKKSYIFPKEYPYWLIYRDKEFDNTANKMILGVFNSFRDRQITKKHTKNKGKIRVLKSRNIRDNEIIDLDGYDSYIDDINDFAVSKFLNKEDVIIIPNLTYYPRATYLPRNTLADGSVALLTLKDNSIKVTKKDLHFYNTEEFHYYYKVARNYGTRSLNIDNNSVYFFGVLKNDRSD